MTLDPGITPFYGIRNQTDSNEINGSSINKIFGEAGQHTPTKQDNEKDVTNSKCKWVNPEKRRKLDTEPYMQHSYLRKYYMGKDQHLPRALKELFTPLKCNLCNCSMGSTVTAKDHYDGKKHTSNIKKWLLEHAEQINAWHMTEINGRGVIPDGLHCKYCDVLLSSDQQAQSHYKGKKHQSVINKGAKKNTQTNLKTRQQEKWSGIPFFKGSNGKDLASNQRFFCEICQIACPSQITFNDHLAGAKHKKRMTLWHNAESTTVAEDNILEDVIRNGNSPTLADLSIYRTPSGKYYCHSCNVTVNSTIQFIQHSESRKHKHKSFSQQKS